MTRMIFVRHGESVGNSERRFYGNFDKGLTELGKAQADKTGEYLLENYKIDIAYGSDLGRAYETGTIIAKKQNLEVIPDIGLREIYAGQWENELFDEIMVKYAEEYAVWKNDIWNARPVDGEPVRKLCERVRESVWKIAEANDGETVLIATHATPIRTLECEWRGKPYEKMSEHPWVKNASVSVIDYDINNHTVTPIIIGETSFMGDITTTLPKNI